MKISREAAAEMGAEAVAISETGCYESPGRRMVEIADAKLVPNTTNNEGVRLVLFRARKRLKQLMGSTLD